MQTRFVPPPEYTYRRPRFEFWERLSWLDLNENRVSIAVLVDDEPKWAWGTINRIDLQGGWINIFLHSSGQAKLVHFLDVSQVVLFDVADKFVYNCEYIRWHIERLGPAAVGRQLRHIEPAAKPSATLDMLTTQVTKHFGWRRIPVQQPDAG